MRFALLGTGIDAMQLVQAVQRDSRHQLTAVADSADSADTPTIRGTPAVAWESLLNTDVAEAIIVGQTDDPDRRADQLRQLVQASVPMVLVHPACEAIVGYELDMIRRDTECVLVPYSPGFTHPVVEKLRQLVGQTHEAPIGKVEQLLFERQMAERGRETVLYELTRDALLIREVLGNVTRLTALGPTSGQMDYAHLNVHLSGPNEVPARWSISATVRAPGARISLVGQAGKATIELDESGGVLTWQIPGIGPSDKPMLSWDAPAAAIDSLVNGGQGRETRPTWDDACRAADLAETVDVSLRRGRTIDVYTQTCTEEDTFKGIMAIGGCGALLLTLFVVLGLAVLESFDIAFLDYPFWQQYPWRILYWRNWPYYLVGLLTLFLSLQLFRFLYPNSSRSR